MHRELHSGAFTAVTLGDCKRLIVEGPGFELPLSIDFDDVDHDAVERDTLQLLKILNEHWHHRGFNFRIH